MAQKILVVDDEESIARLVSYNLKKEGFEVITAVDGLDALVKVKSEKPDLVLLDIMLPGVDGYDVCRMMRKEDITIPVIMLTAKDDELDKVLGLELGGDDYVTKPFSPRELVARVRAILRRTKNAPAASDSQIFSMDNLVVDLPRHEVKVAGQEIQLTPKEFELLEYLIRHAGRVVSRDMLLDQVWDYDFAGDTRIVDVHISRLRDKIEPDPKNPSYIQTIRGVGYRFKERA